MRIFLNDVKYAWRALFKRPLLTVTVAITLALGLGANAAIFNLIDRLVLRPFPRARSRQRRACSPRPDRGSATASETVSPANFLDWRAGGRHASTHLSAMAWWDANLVEREDPERLQGIAGLVRLLRRARHPARRSAAASCATTRPSAAITSSC